MNQAFVDYERMYRATQQITREEFVREVADFFHGDVDYVEGCWFQWCQSPMGYMYSRSPIAQGEMLFKMVQDKAQTEHITRRCFSIRKGNDTDGMG